MVGHFRLPYPLELCQLECVLHAALRCNTHSHTHTLCGCSYNMFEGEMPISFQSALDENLHLLTLLGNPGLRMTSNALPDFLAPNWKV